MSSNLMMVPRVTFIIAQSINTTDYVRNRNHSFEFHFDRNRLIKFFEELIVQNPNIQICYSFNAPYAKSENHSLSDEVPISFACLLSLAEAAAHKNVPIYLYPRGTFPGSSSEKPGKPLNFHDFENIFDLKLDLKSAEEIRKKIEVVGPAKSLVYPADTRARRHDGDQLNLDGTIAITSISSESLAYLLTKGSNVVIPIGDNEYALMTMTPSYNWGPKGDFGINWKTQSDNSTACTALRVPIVIKSNEIFYTKRGTDFMSIFKKEMEKLSKKNKSNFSSNPFHSEVTEKPADDVQSDSEYHEVSNAQYEFPKTSTDNQITETSVVTSSKLVAAAESKEEPSNSDSNEPLSAEQLSSFLNRFKEEMKEEIVGMIQDTVKKYSAKENVANVSRSKKEAEICSVINVNDCVKSEADDSDLPKLLNTLSQIEEQLSNIENIANSNMASTKPHKYWQYGLHGHHRRARDFSSINKRAAMHILKKRMKGSVVELEPDLFAISKSEFELKMSRNVSQSFKFVLYKYGKHRNSKYEVDLTPTIVPAGGIECCIKPATKSVEKSGIGDKGQYIFYDVRFKSKERGKFKCFLKILSNGKVCGNPLCITVRVKQFHSTSDPVDSAEEALPSYSSPRGNRLGNLEPTPAANVDVDEGISVFQEYPSSVSSNSEDEATNRENDNDEGIDTKLDASCSAFEKLSVNEKCKFSPFDEDSDSSISLLLDENEVREVVDEEFESVNIPACFIPNADMSTEPVTVRLKRKINGSHKKKTDTPAAPPPENPSKKNDYWWKLVSGDSPKKTEINPATDNFENLARRRTWKPFTSQHLPQQDPRWSFNKAKRDFDAQPNVTSPRKPLSRRDLRSGFTSEEPVPQNPTFLNLSKAEGDVPHELISALKQVPPHDTHRSHFSKVRKNFGSSSRTDTATEGTYKSLYPTLDEIREPYMKTSKKSTAGSTSRKTMDTATEGSYKSFCPTLDEINKPYTKSSKKSTASKETQSPVAILPEKVFEMTSNVFKTVMNSMKQPNDVKEMQKNIDETLRSFSRSVLGVLSPQSEHTGAAPSEPQAPSAPAESPAVATSQASVANSPATSPQPEPPAWTAASQTPKSDSATAASFPNTNVPAFAFPDPRLPGPAFGPSQTAYSFNAASEADTSNVASAASAPSTTMESNATTAATNIPLTFHTPEKPIKITQTTVREDAPESTLPKSPKGGADFIPDQEYNRLEPDVRKKILQLNEMGFLNDGYNLFLIKKYPEDMDKVVESLVNYGV